MAITVDIRKKLGEFKLDVCFESGEGIMALLGASGCGKSMTLKCIAGIETPDEGRIVLNGRILFDSEKKINLTPQKRRVGYLFQNYALFPKMTVAQNIAAGIADKSQRGDIIAGKIKAFHLEGLEDKYPFQLSGGQQQRVALARILANRPNLIMLDEPFSALDAYLRWQMEIEVSDIISNYGGTTLFVSHSRDEVYRLCDRVSVINDGKSEPAVSVSDLFEKPRTLSAALITGCKNYSRAEIIEGSILRAVDWGVLLDCGKQPDSPTNYIGVRAHYITPTESTGKNTIDCDIIRVIDDVFSTVIMLRPKGAPEQSIYADIRIELQKSDWATLGAKKTLRVKIEPEDIMLLK